MPLAILLVLLGGGCASLASSAKSQAAKDAVRSAQAAADAARSAATQAQSPQEPQYLRFKADETQLTGARDDGRITYLEFASPVAAELELFDQEGRPLVSANAGRVAAVEGLHAGILVRRSDRVSFVSPNPRALSLPRRPLPDTPDHGEARAKLENQAGQLQAMQRAMQAAKLAPVAGNRRGQAAQPAALQPLAQPWGLPEAAGGRQPYAVDATQPRLRHLPQLLRSPQSGHSLAAEAPVPLATPLAMANASASVPERGLVRVFFATASRAIVAPDDGLGLLLREAGNADEIRVTGFTDATGSRATNDALALARADAVVQILLRRGIPAGRILSSAVGADDYIADNASDRGRALNRRAEVLLLRNGEPLAFGSGVRTMR